MFHKFRLFSTSVAIATAVSIATPALAWPFDEGIRMGALANTVMQQQVQDLNQSQQQMQDLDRLQQQIQDLDRLQQMQDPGRLR